MGRPRGGSPCRQRTERPDFAPGPGNLRCDLSLDHAGPHKAGFTFKGKKHFVEWPGRGGCPTGPPGELGEKGVP